MTWARNLYKPVTEFLRAPHQGEHLFFVDDLYLEFARLVELRSGVGTSDDIVGFLADGSGDAAASILDDLLGFVAGVNGERSGKDKCFAHELRAALFLFALELQSLFAKAVDQFDVAGLAEEIANAFGNAWADLFDFFQLGNALVGVGESGGLNNGVHGSEMLG